MPMLPKKRNNEKPDYCVPSELATLENALLRCRDQTHRADHQYQDDGKHDGIFRDILSLFILANIVENLPIELQPRNRLPGKLV